MKKVMFVLAAIVVAGIAHAASVNWQASSITGDGAVKDNMVALYYTEAGAGMDSVLAALEAGTAPAASSTMVISLGKGKVNKVTVDVAGLDTAKAYDFYVVAFDAKTLPEANNYQIVSKTNVGYSSLDGYFAVSGNFSGATWTKMPSGGDVPEPTSGLLLLVGGAMLALRRRRA